MIITPEKVKSLYKDEFSGVPDELLAMKLEAIEAAIRAHTNNNFQMRACRTKAISKGNTLVTYDLVTMLKVGDTVQISKSAYNNGIYVITGITGNVITLDKELIDSDVCLVTKVVYSADIIQGAIELLKWDCGASSKKDKQGIASESISRHSVSYQQYDATNTINGYPSALFGFCGAYMRART